jgi:nucleotide-binding universal stress UspA family protein
VTEVSKVIVGFDGPEHGSDALALGRELALAAGAPIIVAEAFPHRRRRAGAGSRQRPPTDQEAAALAAAVASIDGVEAEARALSGGSVAKALYALTAENPDAILVLSSSHRGALGQTMPGSVVESMLHGSPCPVAIAPRGLARSEFVLRVIGVAYDGSAEARTALELAGSLAGGAAATVRVIGVLDATAEPAGAGAGIQQVATMARAGLRDAIHDAAAALPPQARALPVVCRGNPVPELLSQCEQGVDLLLMGSRGYGPVRSVLLGSTSSMMVRAARCPVIVLPRPRKRAAPGGTEAQPAA